MTVMSESIAAGLIRVEFVPGNTPRRFEVAISNGSGRMKTEIVAGSYDAATGWAANWDSHSRDEAAKRGAPMRSSTCLVSRSMDAMTADYAALEARVSELEHQLRNVLPSRVDAVAYGVSLLHEDTRSMRAETAARFDSIDRSLLAILDRLPPTKP